MKSLLLLAAMLVVAPTCRGADFQGLHLSDDGATLGIRLANGKLLEAPRLGTQDSFEQPRVSADHRHIGWLALYPNKGASYSQPLELVVMDHARHLHRFSGDVGMVFGWCFTPDSQAVVYRASFSHGKTHVEFDMRRVSDGKLLRQFLLEPVGDDGDMDRVVLAKAPPWTRCAQNRPAPP